MLNATLLGFPWISLQRAYLGSVPETASDSGWGKGSYCACNQVVSPSSWALEIQAGAASRGLYQWSWCFDVCLTPVLYFSVGSEVWQIREGLILVPTTAKRFKNTDDIIRRKDFGKSEVYGRSSFLEMSKQKERKAKVKFITSLNEQFFPFNPCSCSWSWMAFRLFHSWQNGSSESLVL